MAIGNTSFSLLEIKLISLNCRLHAIEDILLQHHPEYKEDLEKSFRKYIDEAFEELKKNKELT